VRKKRSRLAYRNALLAVATCCTVVISCRKDPPITDDGIIQQQKISFTVPEGWPQPVYRFENNPLTQEGFELGRKLFFDTRLSRDNAISCGSCHQPFAAFSQLNHAVSHGVDNRLGTRNSPGLFNLNWHPAFFWDGGVNHIESQPVAPIQNPVEMDEKLENILARLQEDMDYRRRFREVFGDETINSQRMFRAIVQFMGALVSNNSKYDRYVRGTGSLTEAELNGLRLFRSHCESCHKEPLFSDFSYRNNGLSPNAVNDSGRAHITLDPADLYRFKVPSLRNLKYTPPYMHDGRFNTLEEVLDHYASGINTSMATLDPALQAGIPLTAAERRDLLAFLNTLNDESFVQDPRFQEP
jgi:cytochrome c peroxidase